MVKSDRTVQGVLELHPKGYGFLRNPTRSYGSQAGDPYVPAPLIQKFSLREGLLLSGPTENGNKGGPRDPQPGNVPSVAVDSLGSPEDDRGTALPI